MHRSEEANNAWSKADCTIKDNDYLFLWNNNYDTIDFLWRLTIEGLLTPDSVCSTILCVGLFV